MPEALGVEADVARLLDQSPEERHAGGDGVDGLPQGLVHVSDLADQFVEGQEERGIRRLFDHGHDAACVALAVFAFEGEWRRCEDNGRDAVVAEVLGGFQRAAAARAAA